jgi:hypothetical protein
MTKRYGAEIIGLDVSVLFDDRPDGYQGSIRDYDAANDMHLVKYQDEQRWYNIGHQERSGDFSMHSVLHSSIGLGFPCPDPYSHACTWPASLLSQVYSHGFRAHHFH